MRWRWNRIKDDVLDVLAVFAWLLAAAVASLSLGVISVILMAAIQGR